MKVSASVNRFLQVTLCRNSAVQDFLCTFAPQTLNMIERLSAEPIQQKQGFRENDSTFARVKD